MHISNAVGVGYTIPTSYAKQDFKSHSCKWQVININEKARSGIRAQYHSFYLANFS